ncbi:MAG: glutamate-1-semialdehyde 2,1-aminomutase [Chromatiales bacterium]|nr:glutamate-1-semialdehyde 2,1-aminomutase [Chromatiales bacterium]
MSEHETLLARAQRVTPGGVHSPVRAFGQVGGTPRFMARAAGAQLTDVDGHEYTDYCLAFGPLILGHAHPVVQAALTGAIERGLGSGTAEPYSLELAEFIAQRVPWAAQLRFVNSGTEAVMTALRLARAATGRHLLLKFAGCYHGHVDAMLVRAGSGLAGRGEGSSAGIPPGVTDDTLVAPLDDEAALETLLARHGSRLAAAIIEPLPANHGLLPQREDFLRALAEGCRRHGALLILDEVISGFRCGFTGMAGRTGITPDLVTWGKIIGGGLPVGALAGDAALMRLLAPEGPVYQAGTLAANPLAMAAGQATLAALADGSVYRQLERLGQRLEAALADEPGGWRLVRRDSLFWLHPADGGPGTLRDPAEIPERHARDWPAIFHALLDQGIYLPPSPFEVGFLSAAHTPGDIDRLAAALRQAVAG